MSSIGRPKMSFVACLYTVLKYKEVVTLTKVPITVSTMP